MSETNQVLRTSRDEWMSGGDPGAAAQRARGGLGALARSSGTAIAGGLVSQTLKALVMILLARSFGASQFGEFSFANSVNAFLFVIAQFGLPIFGAREVAHSGGVPTGLLRATTEARLLLGMLGALAALVILLVLPGVGREEVWLVAGFGLSNVLLSGFYDWVFQGAGKLHLWAISNIAWQGLWLVFTTVLVERRGGIALTSFGYAGAALVAGWVGWPFLRRLHPAGGDATASTPYSVVGVLRASANLGTGTLLITFLVWTDTIIVRFFGGPQAAGVYAAGNRVPLALAMLASFYVLGAFPTLSRLAAASPLDFSAHFQRVYEDLALLFVPGVLWCLVYAPNIIILLFKRPDYLGSVAVFRIFQAFLLAAVASNLFGMGALVPHRRDDAYRKGLLISAGWMLVLCPILVLKWGLSGAAAAVLFSQALSLALFMKDSKDIVRIEHLKTLGVPLMIGAIPLLPRIVFHDGFWYSAGLLVAAYLGIAFWRQPFFRVGSQ